MLPLNATLMLALFATEPSPEPSSTQPSMALLLYLDEFAEIDEEVLVHAAICTDPSAKATEQASATQSLIGCENVPSNFAPTRKSIGSEVEPHD